MNIRILFIIICAMLWNISANSAWAQSYLDIEELSEELSTPQESSQPLNDALIATKINAELTIAEGIKSGDIEVEVVEGIVFLSGTQPNETLIRKAEDIALSIKNVKGVDSSNLVVETSQVD